MKTVIQRVSQASVVINDECVGSIQRGILALIGIEKTDAPIHAERLFKKIIDYRVFPDEAQKMNWNLAQIDGGLLLVPQFTIVAETDKGTRPGFSKGMSPSEGEQLYLYLVKYAKQHYHRVASGIFGADMHIHLINEGPVTFVLNV